MEGRFAWTWFCVAALELANEQPHRRGPCHTRNRQLPTCTISCFEQVSTGSERCNQKFSLALACQWVLNCCQLARSELRNVTEALVLADGQKCFSTFQS
ncbi:MAG TPA: hypothetical protein DDW52_18175 [Planctomycetaceae bacterium]|nr:hypothetical protein [Planctomycetaceae bacterium]